MSLFEKMFQDDEMFDELKQNSVSDILNKEAVHQVLELSQDSAVHAGAELTSRDVHPQRARVMFTFSVLQHVQPLKAFVLKF